MPMISVRSPMGILWFLIFQAVVATVQSKLRRLRMASGDGRKNRLERLRGRFLQLRTIRIAAIGNRRILVKRQACHYPANLNTVKRLTLEQTLSKSNHRLAVLFDDRLRPFKLRGDDLLNLLVDLDRSIFGEVAMLGDFTSEEYLLFLLSKRNRSHLGHAVLADHRARQFSSTFDVV